MQVQPLAGYLLCGPVNRAGSSSVALTRSWTGYPIRTFLSGTAPSRNKNWYSRAAVDASEHTDPRELPITVVTERVSAYSSVTSANQFAARFLPLVAMFRTGSTATSIDRSCCVGSRELPQRPPAIGLFERPDNIGFEQTWLLHAAQAGRYARRVSFGLSRLE